MKKLELLCVGKIKEDWLTRGIGEYVKRLGRYCSVTVREISDRPDDGRAAETESRELVGALNGYVVLADIGGSLLTSEELAAAIDRAYLGSDRVQFVIGGSRGVTDEVRRRADLRVSFGRVTYPHRLMRLIAAEQLYRAFSIIAGTSYHK